MEAEPTQLYIARAERVGHAGARRASHTYTKESTALGASLVSALGIGYYKGLDNIETLRNNNKLESTIDRNLREKIIKNWHKAVKKTIEMAD